VTTDDRDDVRARLDRAYRALTDAEVALLLARPDGPRHSAENGLQTLREELNAIERRLLAQPPVAVAPVANLHDATHGGRQEVTEMDRRLLLRLFGVVGAAAAIPAPMLTRMRELADVLADPDRVDASSLDALDELTATYARQYGIVPPDDLARLVTAHVDQAAARLDLPMSPADRARLGSITSEAASLAGWLHFAAGRRGEGLTLLGFARDNARDADNPTLHALALASLARVQSNVARGRLGRSMIAQRLVAQALALMPADAAPVQRAWVHQIDAVERAVGGDGPGFAGALSHASTIQAQADRDDKGVYSSRGVLTFTDDDAGLRAVEGFGQAVLGHRGAVDALDATQANTSINRTIMLHYSAQALLIAGDVDEAARRTLQGVEQVASGGVTGRLTRFYGLREQMPDDVSAVADLDDRLAAVA